MTTTPVLTPYQRLGGDAPLRQLVERFYDIMLTEPAVEAVRAMHDADTTLIREKFFDFLSGWLGGPQRYIEKHGHPRLRARHASFAIGARERDQWMLCMSRALDEVAMPAELREQLDQAFRQTADFLRNHAER